MRCQRYELGVHRTMYINNKRSTKLIDFLSWKFYGKQDKYIGSAFEAGGHYFVMILLTVWQNSIFSATL